jgi:hypothetical protein
MCHAFRSNNPEWDDSWQLLPTFRQRVSVSYTRLVSCWQKRHSNGSLFRELQNLVSGVCHIRGRLIYSARNCRRRYIALSYLQHYAPNYYFSIYYTVLKWKFFNNSNLISTVNCCSNENEKLSPCSITKCIINSLIKFYEQTFWSFSTRLSTRIWLLWLAEHGVV